MNYENQLHFIGNPEVTLPIFQCGISLNQATKHRSILSAPAMPQVERVEQVCSSLFYDNPTDLNAVYDVYC